MFGAVRGEVEEGGGGDGRATGLSCSHASARSSRGLTCGESPLPTGFMWLPDAEGLMKVSE